MKQNIILGILVGTVGTLLTLEIVAYINEKKRSKTPSETKSNFAIHSDSDKQKVAEKK